MADLVETKETSLEPAEVITRSVQFFTGSRWRTQSQSERIATFAGRPPIPIGMLLLTILGYISCLVPGILLHILVIRRMIQLQNIVVTTKAVGEGSEVVIKYSSTATKLVHEFLEALP
jgi:hypothetical protein